MTRNRAHLMLLLAAMFWGFGNLPQKTVLDHLGPLTAVGGRCLIAALAMLPLVWLEQRSAERRGGFLPSAVLVGVLFAASIGIQQAAFGFTSVTNASFLVNTCTVMVPFVAWVVLGTLPNPRILAAAVVTATGAFLLSGAWWLGSPNAGDVACIASAAFYACWIVVLGRHAAVHGRPMSTALVQFALAAVVFLPLAATAEQIRPGELARALPDLLALGLVTTAAAFALQTAAQRHTSPSTAAVIVSGESVFGALGAALVLGERIVWAGLLGACLILGAILAVALWSGEREEIRPSAARPARSLRPGPKRAGEASVPLVEAVGGDDRP